jgi:hypothetical protein
MSNRSKSQILWKKVRSIVIVLGLVAATNFAVSYADESSQQRAGVSGLSGNVPRPKAGVSGLSGNVPRPKAGVSGLSGNVPRPKAGVSGLSGNVPRP